MMMTWADHPCLAISLARAQTGFCTAYKKAKSAHVTAMRKANTVPLINTALVTLIDE